MTSAIGWSLEVDPVQSLGRAEKETVVRWSMDKTQPGCVSTHDEHQAKRLIRAGARVRRRGQRGVSEYWILEVPVEWCRFPRPKRAVSEAQREAARVRLAGARKGSRSPAVHRDSDTGGVSS